MSNNEDTKIGTIGWTDLTVADAAGVRDFYKAVVGWESQAHSMGDYDDYVMTTPGGQGVAGICHARGSNADVPPQWLVYVTVADANAAAAQCSQLGGTVLLGPRDMGGGRVCVIRDPAGAVCALYQPPAGDA